MNGLNREKGSRRKALRYLRWAVRAAFLLVFVAPIKFFADAAIELPVYSLAYGGFAQPLFTVPYGESVCSFLLLRWTYVGPGAWIVCPLGGFEVMATAAMEPKAGLDIGFLLISVLAAVSIFLLLTFFLGTMFCSWVCPVGTVVDSFDKVVERFMPKQNKKREEQFKQNKKREEQFKQNKEKQGSICFPCFLGKLFNNKHATVANGVLVTALVGSAILRLPLFCSICPVGILARGMFHLKAWTNILGERFLNIRNIMGARIDMPIMIEFVLIIPIVAVLLSLREKRYWCRKICPLGALLKLVSSFNPFFKPTVKADKCVVCKSCERVCPQLADLQERGSAKCSKCLECYIQCKKDAVKIKWFRTPDAVLWLRSFFKAKLKRQPKKQKS